MVRILRARWSWTFLLALGLLGAPGRASAVDFSGWSRHLSISFPGFTRAETLSNFPVLVTFSTAITNFSYDDFAAGGGDLRFSDAAGNELNYELDEWNTGGVSYVWVQVPALASASDSIAAHWGNGAQSAAPAYTTNGATWANGYVGVWHMRESAGDLVNAAVAGNANNGTAYGARPASAPGLVGNGQYNSSQAQNGFNVGKFAALDGKSAITVELLFKASDTTAFSKMVASRNVSAANYNYTLQKNNNGYAKMAVAGQNGGADFAPYAPLTSWHYLAGAYDGAVAGTRLLVDGAAYVDGAVPAGASINAGTNETYLFVRPDLAGQTFVGYLDEVRISSASRSTNWLWACWLNQMSNALFLSYAAVESQAVEAAGILTAAATDISGTSAVLNGNLTSTGASATAVWVYWGPTDGGTNAGAWANTNAFGARDVGAMDHEVAGLSYGTVYYCRYAASNEAGVVWGGRVSFTTLGAPSIVNVGVSGLTPVGATLNGSLTSIGAAPTKVYLYWGPTDGGTNAGSWPAPDDLGERPTGAIATPKTGLTPGGTYYYRYYAANAHGESWASATTRFTTPGAYVWDGGGADDNWSTGGNWDNDAAPVNNGTARVAITGSNRPNPAVDAAWDVQAVAFTNLGSGFTVSGEALTLQAGGLSNANTVAGRSVVISNAITVGAAQTWTLNTLNGITVLAGNLAGSAPITNASPDCRATGVPPLRLAGSNANYTGIFTLWPPGWNGVGTMLMRPEAAIGGTMKGPGTGNGLVGLNGAGVDAPYTVGWGAGVGELDLGPLGGSRGYAVAIGGNVTWDPAGANDDYQWTDAGNARVSVNRYAASDPSVITLGMAGKTLTLTNADKVIDVEAYNNVYAVSRLAYTLQDAPGAARALTKAGAGTLVMAGGAAVGLGATYVTGGALSVSNMNLVFDGNLNLSGGALVLDHLAWADVVTDRSSGYGTGSNQWQLGAGGGFAARGTPVRIDATGTTVTTFDRDFALGSAVRNTDGSYYANAGVEIARPLALTGRRLIAVAPAGPGLTGPEGSGVVYTVSGGISGSGAPTVAGLASSIGVGDVPELVLGGTNTWTGAAWFPYGINTGPGGMVVRGIEGGNVAGRGAFVRFTSNAAIPSGNGGTTAYLAAVLKGNSTAFEFANGYLLTGDGTPTGQRYNLPPGLSFLLGMNNGGAFDNRYSSLGASGGKATLRQADVSVHCAITNDVATSLGLLVRADSELTLGTPADADPLNGPVRFRPTTGYSASDPGTNGPATPLADSVVARTLVKRGEGTLVLGNVAYTKVDDATDASALFAWQLGRGAGGNNGATTYSDGAVRGVLGGNAGNSLAGFKIQFRGGVYELDVSAGSGTFTATVGTATGNLNWRDGDNVDYGGGGFAAYSTVPGHRLTVDLNGPGRDTLLFARSAPSQFYPGANDQFLATNANPLIFGSRTANAAVEFVDNMDFNARILPVRVIDNTSAAADRTVLSGAISNGGLTKQGAGVLELTGSNTYAGVTLVQAGTLLVNGALAAGAGVTVYSNAVLGGTGVVNRAVTVQAGGAIQPGDAGAGVLTVSNLTLAAGARSVFTLGGGSYAAVSGLLTLNGTLVVADAEARPSGVFTLFTYGALNGVDVEVAPLPGGLRATLDLGDPGVVKLRVSAPGVVMSIN